MPLKLFWIVNEKSDRKAHAFLRDALEAGYKEIRHSGHELDLHATRRFGERWFHAFHTSPGAGRRLIEALQRTGAKYDIFLEKQKSDAVGVEQWFVYSAEWA